MAPQQNQLYSLFDRIISFLEKERFNILTLFFWICILSTARMWIEAYLLNYPYKDISLEYVFVQIHLICFFITVYIGGVVILKYFTKQKTAKIANLAALGFVMVIIPPFIDVLMHNNPQPYTYGSPLWFFEYIQSLFGSTSASQNPLFEGGLGIIFELLGITIATSLYVFFRTKSLIKPFLSAITFILLFIVIGSPFLVLLRGLSGQTIHPLFIVRYVALSALFLLILIRISGKKIFSSFIKSSRLLTTAHFSLMTIVGIFIADHLTQVENIRMNLLNIYGDPTFWQVFTGNIGTFFLSVIIIIFIWQYAVLINHIYDISIDKINNQDRVIPQNVLTRKQATRILVIYAFIAIVLGASLGIYSLFLVIIGLLFGTIYSVPPIRIRDSIFATTIIGIGSTIAFFIGYMTPGYVKVMYGEFAGTIMRTYPEVTFEAYSIGLLIFIALTIGPLIKDYKDYEGDKKAGVKNLFTIYGLEKGVTITSILLPIPFFCLLLLFHQPVDIIILVPLGILAGVVFKWLRNSMYVFAIYFPVILYCLLRWFSIIQF